MRASESGGAEASQVVAVSLVVRASPSAPNFISLQWRPGWRRWYRPYGDVCPDVRDTGIGVYLCICMYMCICVCVQVPTLDGRSIPVRLGSVTPETCHVVPGNGMFNNKKKTRGDLKVKISYQVPFYYSLSERSHCGNIA